MNTTVNITSSSDLTQPAPNSTDAMSIELNQKDQTYNLIIFTILNIQNDGSRLTISYFFVLLIAIIVYIQIFKFWRSAHLLKNTHYEKGDDLFYKTIPDYCLKVTGIPVSLQPDQAEKEIKQLLKPLIGDALVQFKIVGEFTQLWTLG